MQFCPAQNGPIVRSRKSDVVQKINEMVQRGDNPGVQSRQKPKKGIAMRILPVATFAPALTATGGLALAQTTSTGTSGTGTTVTSPGDRPYSPNNPPPQPERPTNYGWIGLLGLAGLAGLLPRRTVTPIRTTTSPTDTTTTSTGV